MLSPEIYETLGRIKVGNNLWVTKDGIFSSDAGQNSFCKCEYIWSDNGWWKNYLKIINLYIKYIQDLIKAKNNWFNGPILKLIISLYYYNCTILFNDKNKKWK